MARRATAPGGLPSARPRKRPGSAHAVAPAQARPVAATRALAGWEQAAAEFSTLRDCLRYACSRFEAAGLAFGQGTAGAWDEAVWLALWSLHLPPEPLEPFVDARLTLAERRNLLALVERRCVERLPAAYLTGEAWLRGIRLRCDPRAIVPRSLIAEALEESLNDWLPAGGPATILDLCTGGGSLAIAAALRFAHARVDAVDLSPQALELARENVTDHHLEGRIALSEGDLFEPLAGRRYDLVLCNPPYVSAASMRTLPPEFLVEPQAALAGGRDGMDLIRRILEQAPAHLEEAGSLVLEIGHEAAHFEAAFPRLEFAYLPVSAGDDMLVLVGRDQLVRASSARRSRGERRAPR